MENSSENFCAVRKSSPLLKGISDEFMIAKTRSRNLLALQLLYEVFKLTEIARAVVKTPHNVLMVYIPWESIRRRPLQCCPAPPSHHDDRRGGRAAPADRGGRAHGPQMEQEKSL
jgi:hypothetical protein